MPLANVRMFGSLISLFDVYFVMILKSYQTIKKSVLFLKKEHDIQKEASLCNINSFDIKCEEIFKELFIETDL